ncbi:hypothetical protein FS842_007710 [Serendipita sp. 407]|nr:hypothetical protein FS842_007710 [Serendipita sp. 407]
MPEAWVRAAMLIRANSLIRGHSAVRWKVLEQLADFLQHGITPVIPLRGSISASGDLSPLSYVALALSGNSAIKVFSGPSTSRRITTAPDAIKKSGLRPTTLAPKEHLGLLNGTAFSAAVASLALSDVVQLAVLAQVCTAMGTEALLGTRASYAPFIHEVTRPHPGQIEVAKVITRVLDGSRLASAAHEEEMTVEQDKGQLRQDRYALRTAPQFIGPQIEDILHAMQVVTQECNSTTDNPLIDSKARHVYHGGNFQAMAVTNAMEKTRLAVHHLGKILFAQSTELLNPAFNRGLPPSVAATDPSLNYHAKGIDIATAAYLSELGHLANPVSTHIQSAEMHNQSINSLALISARATVAAADVLTMLTASYLYVLCQALDLRAMQLEFKTGIKELMTELFSKHLSTSNPRSLDSHLPTALENVYQSLDKTVTMDAAPRMEAVASAIVVPLTDSLKGTSQENSIKCIQAIREEFSLKAYDLLQKLRRDYLDGRRGPTPASQYMGKTKSMYEFIRVQLGVSMHGSENLNGFEGGLHSTQMSIGQNITKIYEAIRDGDMQGVLADLVASPRENGFAFSKL